MLWCCQSFGVNIADFSTGAVHEDLVFSLAEIGNGQLGVDFIAQYFKVCSFDIN